MEFVSVALKPVRAMFLQLSGASMNKGFENSSFGDKCNEHTHVTFCNIIRNALL